MWLVVGVFSILSNKEGPRMLLFLPIGKKGFCCPPSFLHLLGNCEHTLLAFPMWYVFYMHRVFFHYHVYLRLKYNYFKINNSLQSIKKSPLYKNVPSVKSYLFLVTLHFYIIVILLRVF